MILSEETLEKLREEIHDFEKFFHEKIDELDKRKSIFDGPSVVDILKESKQKITFIKKLLE